MKILSKRHPMKGVTVITGASIMADPFYQLSQRISNAIENSMKTLSKPEPKLPTKEQLEELYKVGGTQNVHRAGSNDDGEVVIKPFDKVNFVGEAGSEAVIPLVRTTGTLSFEWNNPSYYEQFVVNK